MEWENGVLGSIFVPDVLTPEQYYDSRRDDSRIAPVKRLMTAVLASAALAMAVTLLFVLGYILVKGLPGLRFHFFTQTLQFVGPLSKSTEGGAAHAIVGSFEQVGCPFHRVGSFAEHPGQLRDRGDDRPGDEKPDRRR